MCLTTLLLHLSGLRVLNVAVSDDELTLDVESTAASCPGTVLADLQAHRVVDLLPERTAEGL